MQHLAAEHFCSLKYQENPDYVRFLVWRNKTAANWNNFIRRCLWSKDVPMYPVKGDRLITSKPVFRKIPGGKGKNKWRIVMNNSEECTVIDGTKMKYMQLFKQDYEYWSVSVITEDGVKQTLLCLKGDSKKIYAEQVKYFAQKKQWNQYFDKNRNFDSATYNYAITTHKAQGRSIDHVFLDAADMRYCSDLQKILYTGLTRAMKRVFVCK
ncbi:MAG: ATP-binding domain-containing protein [Xenococcaceae cyanobacterium]